MRCSDGADDRAKERIARQKKEIALPLGKIVDVRKKLYKELQVSTIYTFLVLNTDEQTINNYGSQVGDERPLSTIRFSPNSKMLLTASWSGNAKVWDLPNLDHVSTHRGRWQSRPQLTSRSRRSHEWPRMASSRYHWARRLGSQLCLWRRRSQSQALVSQQRTTYSYIIRSYSSSLPRRISPHIILSRISRFRWYMATVGYDDRKGTHGARRTFKGGLRR